MQPLGIGGTGETWLCKRNDTGQEEAVKVISRGPVLKTLQKLLTNEITLQAELAEGHINVVDMHEVRVCFRAVSNCHAMLRRDSDSGCLHVMLRPDGRLMSCACACTWLRASHDCLHMLHCLLLAHLKRHSHWHVAHQVSGVRLSVGVVD